MTKSFNNLAARILTVFSFALIVSVASAQTSTTPNVLMLPNTNPACESSQGAQLPACAAFLPGAEPFVLLIKATSVNTTAYSYTMIATLPDGSTRVISGQVGRADDGSGYTATSVSLGCDPVSVDTTVVEAGA
jgi:hypothetical protein